MKGFLNYQTFFLCCVYILRCNKLEGFLRSILKFFQRGFIILQISSIIQTPNIARKHQSWVKMSATENSSIYRGKKFTVQAPDGCIVTFYRRYSFRSTVSQCVCHFQSLPFKSRMLPLHRSARRGLPLVGSRCNLYRVTNV